MCQERDFGQGIAGSGLYETGCEYSATTRATGDARPNAPEYRRCYDILELLPPRSSPSLAILDSSVVGFTSRISAAPFLPRIRRPVLSGVEGVVDSLADGAAAQ